MKRLNKIVNKNKFLVREVSGVNLLIEKLFLNINHARRRAIEIKSNNIVRRCILMNLLLKFAAGVQERKGYWCGCRAGQ